MIHPSCYVHESAVVIGLVSLGEGSSIWPMAVLRGDLNRIDVGRGVSVQDHTTLHVDSERGLVVGDYSLIGHRVVLHGCSVGRACLIGTGSVVLDGAEIGDGAQITAGCVVRGDRKIPPRALVVQLGGELRVHPNKADPARTVAASLEYVALAERCRGGRFGPYSPEERASFRERASAIVAESCL